MPSSEAQRLHQHGRAAHGEARLAEAIGAYRQALALAPWFAAAASDLGAALLQTGLPDEAEPVLRHAGELAPGIAQVRGNLGSALQQLGRLDEALTELTSAAALDPGLAVVHFHLGNLFSARADWARAVAAYRRVLAIDPGHGPSLFNLGHGLQQLGRLDESVEAYRLACAAQPQDPRPLANLGTVLKEMNRVVEAADCFRHALALDPGDPLLGQWLRQALSGQIHAWHLPMLADETRNEAYRRAIDKAVKPTSRVLDIGTGSGLLAMMAARAGAASVVACEMSPAVAEAAMAVVADNGYGGSIAIHATKSTALRVGDQIDLPANVLVSEIVDVGLLGEGMLPSVRHALGHLVTADALVIPQGARVHAMLVEVPRLARIHPVRQVSGFDLSAFDRFRVPGDYLDLRLDLEPHRRLSGPVHVVDFDFRHPPPPRPESAPAEHVIDLTVTADGAAHAVAFWFELALDDEIVISTAPGAGSTAWGQAVQFFEHGPAVRAGDRVSLRALISDMRIAFRLETTRSP